MQETYWAQYRRYRRLHPDGVDLFPMQIPPEKQARFIALWHRNVVMSVSQLARLSDISRPTAYKILKKLARRGDVRGEP